MAVVLNSNIGALQVQRLLSRAHKDGSVSVNRLSSGLRINSAGDDAAGLAVASALRVDTRIFSQAVRNVNDAASALAIAEEALGNLSHITTRQQELASQAANGVLSLAQRRAIDAEAQALTEEYNRIVTTTSFNGRELLQPATTMSIQAGVGGAAVLMFDIAAGITTTGYSSEENANVKQIAGGAREITTFDFFEYQSPESGELVFEAVTLHGGEPERSGIYAQDAATMIASGENYVTFSSSAGDYSLNFWVNDLGYFLGEGYGSAIQVDIESWYSAEEVSNAIAGVLSGGGYGVSVEHNYCEIILTDEVSGSDYTDISYAGAISTHTFNSGSSGTMNYDGAYINLSNTEGNYSVSFVLNGATTVSGSSATVSLSEGDSAGAVAAKVRGVLEAFDGGSAFETQLAGASLIWSSLEKGVPAPGGFSCHFNDSMSSSTMTVAWHHDGGQASYFEHSEYITFHSPSAGYGFYFNHNGAEGTPDFPHATNALSIEFSPGESVAGMIESAAMAINTSFGAVFTAVADGTSLTITNDQIGNATNAAVYNDSGGPATCTILQQGDNAATRINFGTDIFTINSHGITTGQRIRLSSTGTLPTNLQPDTDYYAIRLTDNTLRFASSKANAQSGIYVNFNSVGEGTHTVTAYSLDEVTTFSTTVASVDLKTAAGAKSAMSVLDTRLKAIGRELGSLGSSQSRLTCVASTLFSARENYAAAESRIVDADVAAESAELLKQQILQRSGSAILAQVNQTPALALTLLNGVRSG